MPRYFEPGHVLNKPSPLFDRIDLSRLDELKAKYGGQQKTQSAAPAAVVLPTTAAEATKAVADQAEKVRALKASGVEKAVWQPEVDLLLKLKKHMASLSTTAGPSAAASQSKVMFTVATKAVANQAEKVRLLKASGAAKIDWQPEVDLLLKLKKQLASVTPAPIVIPTSPEELARALFNQAEKVRLLKAKGGPKIEWEAEEDIMLKLKAKLDTFPSATAAAATLAPRPPEEVAAEKAVADQAEKVRQLKTGGAAKSVWQPEVDRLLALKQQLTALTGVEAAPAPSKKASKKK